MKNKQKKNLKEGRIFRFEGGTQIRDVRYMRMDQDETKQIAMEHAELLLNDRVPSWGMFEGRE